MDTFTEFNFDDLAMDEQLFADYRSKYLDLYDKVKSDNSKEKVSILDDIDFELELIRRDKINVSYIISLLQNMQDATPEERKKQHKKLMDVLDSDAQLRSKKELIENSLQSTSPIFPRVEILVPSSIVIGMWSGKKRSPSLVPPRSWILKGLRTSLAISCRLPRADTANSGT